MARRKYRWTVDGMQARSDATNAFDTWVEKAVDDGEGGIGWSRDVPGGNHRDVIISSQTILGVTEGAGGIAAKQQALAQLIDDDVASWGLDLSATAVEAVEDLGVTWPVSKVLRE